MKHFPIPRVLAPLASLVLLAGCLACTHGDESKGPLTSLPEVWVSEVKRDAKPLQSLDLKHDDDSDLRFLGDTLQNRRIVALGESGHGVAEFSQAKTRLIKYLHEQQGYDVIAFESSILSCFRANEQGDQLTAAQLLEHSIFGVWNTTDVVELFDYIKSTRSTERPLILAGFDVQFTTGAEMAERPSLFQEVVARVDPEYAQQVYDLDRALVASLSTNGFFSGHGSDLKAKYQALTAFLDSHMPELLAAYPGRPLFPKVLRQAAWGMGAFLDELIAYEENKWAMSNNFRDAGMAANLQVVVDSLYKDKKVMVWAHNFHISRDEGAIVGEGEGIKNMGTWISERYQAAYYAVGLFMYQGQAATNAREPYLIPAADPISLEGLLHTTGDASHFLDLAAATPGDDTHWMDSSLAARAWGITPIHLVPRHQYDGLLMVDTVHCPVYR